MLPVFITLNLRSVMNVDWEARLAAEEKEAMENGKIEEELDNDQAGGKKRNTGTNAFLTFNLAYKAMKSAKSLPPAAGLPVRGESMRLFTCP